MKQNSSLRKKARELKYFIKYGCPNIIRPNVQISEHAQNKLEELKKNGVVKFQDDYLLKVSDYIDTEYFQKIHNLGFENAEKTIKKNDQYLFIKPSIPNAKKVENDGGGVEIQSFISFKDKNVSDIFINKDIASILYNYYQRQPYYRNYPTIQKMSLKHNQTPVGNGYWHVDHFRQISFMLLINDITTSDSHMKYLLQSHKKNNNIGNISDEYAHYLDKNDKNIVNLVGKKGTLYIFDASGIHRGFYIPGTTRKILHINVTTGNNLSGDKFDDFSTWEKLMNKEKYIVSMFNKV